SAVVEVGYDPTLIVLRVFDEYSACCDLRVALSPALLHVGAQLRVSGFELATHDREVRLHVLGVGADGLTQLFAIDRLPVVCAFDVGADRFGGSTTGTQTGSHERGEAYREPAEPRTHILKTASLVAASIARRFYCL